MAPSHRTPAANNKLHKSLNQELANLEEHLSTLRYHTDDFGDCTSDPREKTYIWGILALFLGSYLFEMGSEHAAYQLQLYAADSDLELFNMLLGPPLLSIFVPSLPSHISSIAYNNGLPKDSISTMTWLKRPNCRLATQTLASVKPIISSMPPRSLSRVM
ncbi:hypothetical protein DXG03_007897 [Asterophora parasitica]|uniref:Uncharacterized protein n=1 Tax=Asterophora parasitica TaxID=117018 RepID=A0A9P7G0P4_9AGAR|nr:hypothetical protein DXG03_007897 [Asterophora parasitica]